VPLRRDDAEVNALSAAFTTAMDQLGPFEWCPELAVAVSGGADSMALALLARDWVRLRGGTVVALIVDHGLRAASGDEARITAERLGGLGIRSRVLRLTGLTLGPAMAERARIGRYEALSRACAEAGCLHLLLGHHAADQAETLAMRVLRGSQTHGLAGMAALRELAGVRLLRPLLGVAPGALRQFLTGLGVGWIEDPSNHDLRALRPRLRRALVTAPALGDALSSVGRLRRREEAETASELAACASIRPEGFALLSGGRIGVDALRSLIGMIGGAPYKPTPSLVTELAARMRPATVAGVRILKAGRLADGMLIVREEAAIGPAVPASCGAVWDRRFRLIAPTSVPTGAMIGALGDDSVRFRRCSHLPSVVLRTLPAIRCGEKLASVPHLGYGCQENDWGVTMLFSPARQAAGAAFVPAG
jgi:tRNA(Ile)-lysidine synthase